MATNLARLKFLLECYRSFAINLFKGLDSEDWELDPAKRRKKENSKHYCFLLYSSKYNLSHYIIEMRRESVAFRTVRAQLVCNILTRELAGNFFNWQNSLM